MRWIKHDTDCSADAKIKKLRIKYGLEGYGLYWYCLELIAKDVEYNNLTFELEHDAEIIAFDTGIHYERVQEMMQHMVKLGLFEQDGGVIRCIKLAQRLDQSMTSNPNMRKMIGKIKQNHDGVMTESGTIMQEEIRLDKNRKDKEYAFEGNTFRITSADFQQMTQNYKNLDLLAELNQLDMELRGEKKWFMTMHSKLNYRNKNHEKSKRANKPASAVDRVRAATGQ